MESDKGKKGYKSISQKIIKILLIAGAIYLVWFGCAIVYLALTVKHNLNFYSDDYFEYAVNSYQVSIIGFTELGQEQEILEVPLDYDGLPIVQIGRKDKGLFYDNTYAVYSEKLSKLYLNEEMESLENFNCSNVEVMICSNEVNLKFDEDSTPKNVYIYKSLLESGYYASGRYSPANIAFMNNYSNEVNGGYYRLDNVQTGETITTPPEPTRNTSNLSGLYYTFGGWFIEPECTAEWDFEVSPTIEDDAEFRLYAKWIEV